MSKESVAMSLAHYYGMQCLRSDKTPQELTYMQRKQYWGEEAPFGERLEAFGAAVILNAFALFKSFAKEAGNIKVDFNYSAVL